MELVGKKINIFLRNNIKYTNCEVLMVNSDFIVIRDSYTGGEVWLPVRGVNNIEVVK